MLAGEPTIYVKIAESGNQRAQGFCSRCGTQIYATSVGEGPKVFNLRVGSLQQRADLRPTHQIWCQSELSWLATLDSIERCDQQ